MISYKDKIEEKRKNLVAVLIESMKENPVQWEQGWHSFSAPQNGQTEKNYNGLNALVLHLTAKKKGYKDQRWLTFNQAKEMGASVKAGEKGSEIFYWSMYDKATKKDFDRKTVDAMSFDERQKYEKENVRPVIKFYTVFNEKQCDNFPKNTKKELQREELLTARNEQIENIIRSNAAPIVRGGSVAEYNLTLDKIYLPELKNFKSQDDYYATALHEIAHSTGHASRLNRDLSGAFGSKAYSMEELRAELSSVFMQADYGIQINGSHCANHAAYLKNWIEWLEKEPTALFTISSDAEKISSYIASNAQAKVATTSGVEKPQTPTKEDVKQEMKAPTVPTVVEVPPVVQIDGSEYTLLNEHVGRKMSIFEADALFEKTLQSDEIAKASEDGYFKTQFSIFYGAVKDNGEREQYSGRIDSDERCGVIEHISSLANYTLKHIDELFAKEQILEKAEELKNAQSIVEEFVPYLRRWSGEEETDKAILDFARNARNTAENHLPQDEYLKNRMKAYLQLNVPGHDESGILYIERDVCLAKLMYFDGIVEKSKKQVKDEADTLLKLQCLDEILQDKDILTLAAETKQKYFEDTLCYETDSADMAGVEEYYLRYQKAKSQKTQEKNYNKAANSDKQAVQKSNKSVNIPKEREEELNWWFDNETNDEETQEWRDTLTKDEEKLIKSWDKDYLTAATKVLADIKEAVENTKEKQSEKSETVEQVEQNIEKKVIEQAREAAHAAGLPFSDKLYDGDEEFDPYVFDGSMNLQDYELMHELIDADKQKKVVEQVKQVEQVKKTQKENMIKIPVEMVGKEYGKTTLIRMPKGGQFSSFVFFAPTKDLVREEDAGVVLLDCRKGLDISLKNDGKMVEVTGEELRAILDGQEIGKRAHRVSPPKRNSERFAALEANVPDEMKEIPNWCVFRTKWNKEKEKKEKFILSPTNGQWADSTDPGTWTDFNTAMEYAKENGCEGLSFALGNGVSCIDLDKCLNKDGALSELAQRAVSELSSTYTERSVSGNGIHIFLKDDLLAKGKYKNRAETPSGELEVYSTGRFMSMTGDLLGSSKVLTPCPVETTAWLREALGRRASDVSKTNTATVSNMANMSDQEVVARILRSKKGAQFETLYGGGDITGDKSRDDLALLNCLAYFTDCNKSQMEAIFKSSARYRAKEKTENYLTRSVEKACVSLKSRIGQDSGSRGSGENRQAK